ncbi:hypothetical protein I4940_00005 [Pseudomonas aeruginosa]|nr:hypothetical protein [Pseudomonas aeruginosa]
MAAKGLAGTPLRDAPASVEQAGGDERAKFEYWASDEGIYPKAVERSGNCYKLAQTQSYWMAWQARAALAQPSPAQAEQAEGAHVPDEVFAGVFAEWWEEEGQYCRAGGGDYERTFAFQAWRHLYPLLLQARAALAQPSPAPAEAERPEVMAYLFVKPNGTLSMDAVRHKPSQPAVAVMTVAQHERIVEARWNRAMDLMDEHVARISEKFKAERDAALARVEQQERTIASMNEAHAKLAGLYEAAQAQHSVPEGWMLVECGIWTQEQVDEMQKTVTRFRNSEFVDDRALAMAVADAGQCKAPEISLAELLAAAPGKEVPQAWLDVQAERRRQITAEGWTPEHDDEHDNGEMALAAASYAAYAHTEPSGDLPFCWPWDKDWWKPSTARRDLVKACALALAEIERLDRATATQGGPRDA